MHAKYANPIYGDLSSFGQFEVRFISRESNYNRAQRVYPDLLHCFQLLRDSGRMPRFSPPLHLSEERLSGKNSSIIFL